MNAPITRPNRSPPWCRSSLKVPAIRRSFRRTTYLALRSEHLETLVLAGKPVVTRAGTLGFVSVPALLASISAKS